MPEYPDHLTTKHISIAVLIIFASLALGACAGVAYQKHADARVRIENEATIVQLQTALAEATQREAERMAQASALPQPQTTPPIPTPTPPAPPAISSFIAPKKGDYLCRNTLYTLAWRADVSRIDEIRITIPNASAPIAPIADVPVSYNETGERGTGTVDWRVGTGTFGLPGPGGTAQTLDLPDGELYRLRLEALKNGTVIESYDRGPFAVETCEG